MTPMADKKERERIIEILKSGEFTFSFHDSSYGTLIPKTTKSYEEAGDLQEGGVESYDLDMDSYGDGLVDVLIEALGGNLYST